MVPAKRMEFEVSIDQAADRLQCRAMVGSYCSTWVRSAGTENVMMIAALGRACQLLAASLNDDQVDRHSEALRNRLLQGLQRTVPGIRRNGHPIRTLPNTLRYRSALTKQQ
jgi:cysteine sulfinate desulfinase/cysteine desulfurase-like protein